MGLLNTPLLQTLKLGNIILLVYYSIRIISYIDLTPRCFFIVIFLILSILVTPNIILKIISQAYKNFWKEHRHSRTSVRFILFVYISVYFLYCTFTCTLIAYKRIVKHSKIQSVFQQDHFSNFSQVTQFVIWPQPFRYKTKKSCLLSLSVNFLLNSCTRNVF